MKPTPNPFIEGASMKRSPRTRLQRTRATRSPLKRSPLTAIRRGSAESRTPLAFSFEAFWHALLVGLPIALSVSRLSFRQARGGDV